MKCGILGAWSRGTALAQVLALNGHQPTLWSISEQDCANIQTKRENSEFLSDILLHDNISCTTSLEEATKKADLIVLALPSFALSSWLQQLKPFYLKQPIVLASKWWSWSDFSPLSSLVFQAFWDVPLVVLSGASHAEEVVKWLPTGVVLASLDLQYAKKIQTYFQNTWFRCDLSSDIIGTQLMGAFKNLIALACGISDGLGYGSNTKAFLIIKGIQEILSIWEFVGANSATLLTFAGIGDLYVTCSSSLSRNRNAGRLLAKWYTKEQITWEMMKMVAESLSMIDMLDTFLEKEEVTCPLLSMIIRIVHEPRGARDSFSSFFEWS